MHCIQGVFDILHGGHSCSLTLKMKTKQGIWLQSLGAGGEGILNCNLLIVHKLLPIAIEPVREFGEGLLWLHCNVHKCRAHSGMGAEGTTGVPCDIRN